MNANPPVVLAMAGLPGTGKSTLARALAAELGAPILDKDAVRAAMFGPDRIEYSRAQDDLCMRAVYAEVARLAADSPVPTVPARVLAILDGRTYSRHEQVTALLAAARDAGAALLVVECRCADAVAERRLAEDLARGAHPARNRNPALYRELRAQAEPLEPVLAAAAAVAALAPAPAAAASPTAPASAAPGAVVRHLILSTDDTGAAAHARRVADVLGALALLARDPRSGP